MAIVPLANVADAGIEQIKRVAVHSISAQFNVPGSITVVSEVNPAPYIVKFPPPENRDH